MLHGDRGSISGFVVVVMLAALVCLGLVVDGGQKIRAYREAYAVAEEAARAGPASSTSTARTPRAAGLSWTAVTRWPRPARTSPRRDTGGASR